MTFYSNLAATAQRLVNQFGGPVTLRRPDAGTYDPVTGEGTAGAPTDYPLKGLLLDYKSIGSGMKYAEGTEIRADDKRLLLAAEGLAITPEPTDRAIVGAVSYQVVNIKKINPAGTPVLYELQVRK